MLLRLGAHAVHVCPGARAVHMRSGTLTERRPLGTVLGAWSGREGGLGRGCGARAALVQRRLCSGASCGGARQPTSGRGARAAASCDMGLAARMLSSELEMYPMIAVAHEIAMVRTAGSICMARSDPEPRHRGSQPPRRQSARQTSRGCVADRCVAETKRASTVCHLPSSRYAQDNMLIQS